MFLIICAIFLLFLGFSLYYNIKKIINQLIYTIKNNKINFKSILETAKSELRLKIIVNKFGTTLKKYMKSNSINKYYFCISLFLLFLMTEIITEKFWKYLLLFIILLIWVRIIYNIIYKQDEVIKNYMTIYILYISFALFSTYIPNLLDVNYFNNTLFAIFMFTNSVSLILAIKIFLSTDMKPIVYDFTLLMLLFYAGITIIASYFLIGWGSIYYELNMENKDAKNYTLNIKNNKNDTYAYIIAFIYNGFTALKSFDALEVINVKDVSSKQGNLTADSIIFRMISVFFSFLYISIITAFFMNLFTQGKKKN